MAKKVYSESVKKWGKRVGIGGGVVSIFSLIIMYLISTGSITPISHSGDMHCADTIEDPCYGEITFRANEDIFIYQIGYDPWGRNTTFQFQPGVKEWKLQRKWGDGWRDYDLKNPCTSTWCGAPSSDSDVKYSLVWRKGKEYTIRIVALKNNPNDVIKWSAFDNEVDPYWLAPVNNNISIILREKNENHTIFWNETKKDYFINKTCVWFENNQSLGPCSQLNYTEIIEHSKVIIDKEWQEITFNGTTINLKNFSVWCWDEGQVIWCKSLLDGDGIFKQRGIKSGTSYFLINYTSDKSIMFYSDDYYGDFYMRNLQKLIE